MRSSELHRAAVRETLRALEFYVRRIDGVPVIMKSRTGVGALDEAGIEKLAIDADVRPDEARSVLKALGILP